ncbi:MAG: tRNA (adenosine(37)-N6)-threonylcarbamoyltransferase complex ATPase subunit type 1 TsaE [Prolixibacteraceae bacterium]|nr:tRNA (adenosine(37)-N6)-threonylcarbamoyltransferase complex ATPase subunit type 1 TsaE [Prolixibacteraceae bacterium]
MRTIQIATLHDLETAAQTFMNMMGTYKVFAFYGEMGAGKTTFIKQVCRLMGVEENITSPTFSIVNEYIASGGNSIYHFDCYRLKNLEEAYNIGAEEYLYSGNYCFIEWPERMEELLPESAIAVKIEVQAKNHRIISVNIP